MQVSGCIGCMGQTSESEEFRPRPSVAKVRPKPQLAQKSVSVPTPGSKIGCAGPVKIAFIHVMSLSSDLAVSGHSGSCPDLSQCARLSVSHEHYRSEVLPRPQRLPSTCAHTCAHTDENMLTWISDESTIPATRTSQHFEWASRIHT